MKCLFWHESNKADPRAKPVHDRHYNRQNPESPQYGPPGRLVSLVTRAADAVWLTSWPFAEHVRHAWPGAWVCSTFRNEGVQRSSSLIREAVAVTRHVFGEPPALGMVTFVDASKVRTGRASMPEKALGKCYQKAGFRRVGETKGGLVALQLLPQDMPGPVAPLPRILPDGTIQGVLA